VDGGSVSKDEAKPWRWPVCQRSGHVQHPGYECRTCRMERHGVSPEQMEQSLRDVLGDELYERIAKDP